MRGGRPRDGLAAPGPAVVHSPGFFFSTPGKRSEARFASGAGASPRIEAQNSPAFPSLTGSELPPLMLKTFHHEQ